MLLSTITGGPSDRVEKVVLIVISQAHVICTAGPLGKSEEGIAVDSYPDVPQ